MQFIYQCMMRTKTDEYQSRSFKHKQRIINDIENMIKNVQKVVRTAVGA